MGQAKRRGTFEERKANAIRENEELAEQRKKLQELAAKQVKIHVPQAIRRKRAFLGTLLATAAALSNNMSAKPSVNPDPADDDKL